MKRILVPTDFSDHAMFALKVAAQLAKNHDAELLLINLLDLPTQMNDLISSGVNIPEVMFFLKKTNERLDDMMEEYFLNDLKVSTLVKIDKAFSGIIKYSLEYEVDLIVMGSHGQSGFQDMIIGSTTEKIVRLSNVPVLVVKQSLDNFKSKNLVFASDFSEEIKIPFEKMTQIAQIFEAHLNLVMINTPNSFKSNIVAERHMADFVQAYELQNYSLHIYNDTNIEKGILNFANKVDADIICVCTHGRTTFAHLFVGSISEGVMNHAPKPVLTFKI